MIENEFDSTEDEDASEQLIEDEALAEADTRDSPLMGSDEGYTLNSEEFKQRIQERKKKLLENPIVSEVKSGGSDKQPQDVSAEYPMVEGKRRLKEGSDNSGETKSPLQ